MRSFNAGDSPKELAYLTMSIAGRYTEVFCPNPSRQPEYILGSYCYFAYPVWARQACVSSTLEVGLPIEYS